METAVGLLGLSWIAGQIMGIVIVFGGWKNCPKRLRITIGVAQCLFFIGCMGLAMD